MSIVAYAIRTCLWRALVNETLAGPRVYDSAVESLDEMVQGDPKPFLVISTDDEALTPKGWALSDAEREMTIVIEIAVGGLVEVPPAEGGGEQLSIPHTDEGLETSLNMIGRQVFRAVQVGGTWADLLREIACRPKKVEVKRGASAEGIRFAARQYLITTDTIEEPEFGAVPTGVWAAFLTAMRDDPVLADQADMVEGMMIGEQLPEWRRMQADLGMTKAARIAVAHGPIGDIERVFAADELTVVTNGRSRTVVANPLP
jgi:hypothetical protein